MAAILRAAMRRAFRPVYLEDLLTIFRGPAQGELVVTKKQPDVAVKKRSTSRYAKRSTHARKKTDRPLNLQTWFVGTFLTCTFLEGHAAYLKSKGNDKKTAEGMNEN